MKRVVYYARVSTLEESQLNAIESQIVQLEKFIGEDSDWELVDKYVDKGKSGTTDKGRTQYNRLFADIALDKFDVIVVKDESRLNRNMLNFYQILNEIIINEKKLYFYLERKFYDANDDMIVGIKALMAKDYSRDLSKKINDAHKQRQSNGKPCTSGLILGYDIVNKDLVVNEGQAKTVRFIYEKYVEGNGFRVISKLLFEKGIKNLKGKQYDETTLRRILANEKYKGDLVSNKFHFDFDTKKRYKITNDKWETHIDAVPFIVSRELWEQANDLLKEKKTSIDREKFTGLHQGRYNYSSKIVCSTCGKNFTYNIRTNCKTNVWICSTYRKLAKVECNNNTKLNMDDINNIMQSVLDDIWINRKENFDKLLFVFDKVLGENKNEDTKKLVKDKETINKRKSNLINMRSDSEITKEEFILYKQGYDEDINIIDKELGEIESKNKNLLNKKERLVKIQNILGKYSNIDKKLELDEEIIHTFLDRIVVKTHNEVYVYLLNGFVYKIVLNGNNGRSNRTVVKVELIY